MSIRYFKKIIICEAKYNLIVNNKINCKINNRYEISENRYKIN